MGSRIGQIAQAAEWIAGLSLSDIPADVIRLARAQRVNILASLYAGARTTIGRKVMAGIDAIGEAGSVLTLPDGKKRSLLSAAYVQSVCATALELDDFVFAGHTGQAAVVVPLTLGQMTGATGDEALVAQIAANEVAGRLGAVMTAGPQHGHMKAYLHRAAAATAAARLLGLDADRTASALAIALGTPEYPLFPTAFSPDSKALCVGDPVTGGLRAAFLATDGFDVAPDVVEHNVGLVTSLSNHDRAPPIWDRLGITWSLQAICFKPMAACAYACAAAQAASELVEAEADSWDPHAVQDVVVPTTALTLTMEGFSAPHIPGVVTPVNTNFSTRKTVALALLEGIPTGDHFVPDRFEELRVPIGDMASRVHLTHHWPYTINLLRGVDAAIDYPGRPGIYGMVEAHRTFDRFRAAFDTPAAVSAKDIVPLLRMGKRDLGYLLRRYAVGLRARLPFLGGAIARQAYVARETDLRQMSLRFGAGVRIKLRGGRLMSHEVLTPRGFAGDPDRESIPPVKFVREVGSATSPSHARMLLDLLDREETASPTEVATAACSSRAIGMASAGHERTASHMGER